MIDWIGYRAAREDTATSGLIIMVRDEEGVWRDVIGGRSRIYVLRGGIANDRRHGTVEGPVYLNEDNHGRQTFSVWLAVFVRTNDGRMDVDAVELRLEKKGHSLKKMKIAVTFRGVGKLIFTQSTIISKLAIRPTSAIVDGTTSDFRRCCNLIVAAW
jgi:hypothetical protein